jgi:DnaJ-domain-containing protein 1
MGLGRKILDGMNSVMDKVAVDDTPLSHVDEAELQAELEQRVAMRKVAKKAPADNPRARFAGASREARRERQKRAEARAQKVGSARSARERAERAARDRAFRDAQAQARAQASRQRARGTSRKRTRARTPFARKDEKIARYYKILDLPYGADFDQVKAAYRKLIRRYHPDLHGGSPQKQKAATELTMRVTQAYNELEQHLTGGPNKGA